MQNQVEQQAARLNEYLGRLGIHLAPHRTVEAIVHALEAQPPQREPRQSNPGGGNQ